MRNNTGEKAEISNDRSCTISVVPTLAPSMMASAGTRLTTPSAAKRGGHQAGSGARLQEGGQAEAGGESGKAVAECLAEEAPQVGTERTQNTAEDHVQAP